MREPVWTIIKALPLGITLPVVLAAGTVAPDDVASNYAKWAHSIGIERVPAWLAEKAADQRALVWGISLAFLYAFLVWGIPSIWHHLRPPVVSSPSRIELDGDTGVTKLTLAASVPDWSIRELFFHIAPHLPHDPRAQGWMQIGADVMDRFSTPIARMGAANHAAGAPERATCGN